MSNYDHLIEAHESAITDLADDIDYVHSNGQWVENADALSSAHARLVNRQAVLFATREGF